MADDVFVKELIAALALTTSHLNDCDGYAVLVVDSTCGEIDAYGPMAGMDALTEADRFSRDITREAMDGVMVAVIRMHSSDVKPGRAPS